MKKRLIRLTAFIVLFGTMICGSNANAQKVIINATNFPDGELRKALQYSLDESEMLSKESNGSYSVETDNIDDLDISRDSNDKLYNIQNAKGLELFTNITQLNIAYNGASLVLSNNKLTSLSIYTKADITVEAPVVTNLSIDGLQTAKAFDISKLTNLISLSLNGLVSDSLIINSANLEVISLGSSKINSLDMTSCNKLKYIYHINEANSIKSVKLPTSLISIQLDKCKLPSIDVSMCQNLKSLRVNENNLSDINVSKNAKLELLDVGGNTNIKKLDVSKNTKLKFVNVIDTNVSKIVSPNNNNLAMALSIKKGKSIKTANYFGKGYKLDTSKKAKKKSAMEPYDFLTFYKISECKINFASKLVSYNKKKGTIKLSKKAKKGNVSYCCYMKKGKRIRKIYITAK